MKTLKHLTLFTSILLFCLWAIISTRKALAPEVSQFRTEAPSFSAAETLDLNQYIDYQILDSALANSGNRVALLLARNNSRLLLAWDQGGSLQKVSPADLCVSKGMQISWDGQRIVFLASPSHLPCPTSNDEKLSTLYLWEQGTGLHTVVSNRFSADMLLRLSPDGMKAILLQQHADLSSEPGGNPLLLHLDPHSATLDYSELTSTFASLKIEDIAISQLEISALGKIGSSVQLIRNRRGPQNALTDVDGDKRSDFLVFDPKHKSLPWYAYSLSGVDAPGQGIAHNLGKIYTWHFGLANSLPVEADFNGDGALDLATYHPGLISSQSSEQGLWKVLLSDERNQLTLNSNSPTLERNWGGPCSSPIAGDYDGDGRADLAVYYPTMSIWRILFSRDNWNIAKGRAELGESSFTARFGPKGGFPLKGDFDGDGRLDPALWFPAQSAQQQAHWFFSYLPNEKGNKRPDREIRFGLQGDVPVPADYTGDGATDLAVYRPSLLSWFIKAGSDTIQIPWGVEKGFPLADDFDGDGRADLAFWIPEGVVHWAILPSSMTPTELQKVISQLAVEKRFSWKPLSGEPTEITRRNYFFEVSKGTPSECLELRYYN